MSEQKQIEELKKLMTGKRGKRSYAERLGVPVEEIERLIKKVKYELEDIEEGLEIEGETRKYNLDKGTLEVSAIYSFPPDPQTVIKDHRIDEKEYQLSAYYSKGHKNGTYTATALFRKISKEQVVVNSFQEFLGNYEPCFKFTKLDKKDLQLSEGALIINKQDAHLDKRDLSGYGNDIQARFKEYEDGLDNTLLRAKALSNLSDIIYIIGSDHFNAEVTGLTVKGTPQQNMIGYHEGFELVCNHEISVIEKLLQTGKKVEVIYLLGNHDATVSFHMASWLKVYFRNEKRINIEISPEFTKYFSLFDTAVAINHGDVQKPERLVQNFPLAYKAGFGDANHHIVLTGDRHTELTRDIGGVKFYQIPAISKAKGSWDKQMGYTETKAQITSFLIEPGQGVSTILKVTL